MSRRGKGRGRYEIKITNLNKSYKLNEAFIKRIISKIIKKVNKKLKTATLEVVFLNDRSMKTFNKKYTGRDRATDVLCFDIGVGESGSGGGVADILISLEAAARNSKIFKVDLESEIVRYIIHAILHLTGQDDETDREKARMAREETAILDQVCEREDLSKVLTPR